MNDLQLKEIKKILQITDNSKDGYITEMLPLVIDFVRDYCNNPQLELRSGVVIAIAKTIEFYMNNTSLASKTVSRMSETFSNAIPASILNLLEPYKTNGDSNGKVKFF